MNRGSERRAPSMKPLREQTLTETTAIIRDLTTDGCSFAPDLNIRPCCNHHDYHYRNATMSRATADRLLRQCIGQQGIGFYRYRLLPWVYWLAVRLFGWLYYRKRDRLDG